MLNNRRRAAHLSIICTFALLLLTASFGYRSYSLTERAVVSDLNQALQQTIMQNSQLWMSRDTIRAYTHLSEVFGNPIAIESYNRSFAEALQHNEIRDLSGLIVQVKNKKMTEHPQLYTSKVKAANYLASDTVIWLSANGAAQTLPTDNIGVSFQGYAACTPFTILTMMDKQLPLIMLILSFMTSALYIYLRRTRNDSATATGNDEAKRIHFGNLALSCNEEFFYKTDGEKLKLTPLQYNLMEMFFYSPTHILQRSNICDALWPGKDNADETLNTLMRRLRPLVEDNSNLKITTDRGRAYILEIAES